MLGARFYYHRAILHDHPDNRASDSIVLLDEMVLPDTGVESYAAAVNLIMMVATGAHERSKMRWCELVERTGL